MAGRRSAEQITQDLIKEGTDLIVVAHEQGEALTTTYRKLAEVLVDLRKRFKGRDDKADIAGRTQEYRNTVAKMYSDAGIPEDSQSNIQAAIRYHIGNVLREKFTEDQLTEAGLNPAGPRERARTRNQAGQVAASGTGTTAAVGYDSEEEMVKDMVATLASVAADHPEVIVLDLTGQENDPLPLLQEALSLVLRAHGLDLTAENVEAVQSVVDQIMAEAAAFRLDTQKVKTASQRTSAAR